MNSNKNEFILRLKSIRKKTKMSQRDFSKFCGVKANLISQYECGKRYPSSYNSIKICRAVNISRDWLIGGLGSDNDPYEGNELKNVSFKTFRDGSIRIMYDAYPCKIQLDLTPSQKERLVSFIANKEY